MTDPWITRFEERRKERADAARTFDLLGETWTVPVICDDTVFDKQAVAHIIRCMPKLLYADDAAALLAQY